MAKESKFDGTPLSGAHISPELSKFLANVDTGAMKAAQGTALANLLDGTSDLSGPATAASIAVTGAATVGTTLGVTGAATLGSIAGPLNHDGAAVGFFAKAPAAQVADMAALTDNSGGGAADNTIAPVGATNGGDESGPINGNFRELAEKVNAIRTCLRAYGLMA